jgi:hypothetical protein
LFCCCFLLSTSSRAGSRGSIKNPVSRIGLCPIQRSATVHQDEGAQVTLVVSLVTTSRSSWQPNGPQQPSFASVKKEPKNIRRRNQDLDSLSLLSASLRTAPTSPSFGIRSVACSEFVWNLDGPTPASTKL